jgi:hypothetical protein
MDVHRIGFTGAGDITLSQGCVPMLDGMPLHGVKSITITAAVGQLNRVVIEMDAELGEGIDFTGAVGPA